jgi:hypothetical protein
MLYSKNRTYEFYVAPDQTKDETPAGPGSSIPPDGSDSSDAQIPHHHALLVTRGHGWRPQRVCDIAMAFGFSALAPAMLVTAIWSDPGVAPMVFVLTLAVAFGHAVLLGVPLFLFFRSRGWTGIPACTVIGFVIGAVPVGILTFPVPGLAFYANAWAGDVRAAANGPDIAATWIGYIEPLLYGGLIGAFGGLVFRSVLMSLGMLDQHAGDVDIL